MHDLDNFGKAFILIQFFMALNVIFDNNFKCYFYLYFHIKSLYVYFNSILAKFSYCQSIFLGKKEFKPFMNLKIPNENMHFKQSE